MAAYYNGGRPMSYSNTEESFDGGRTVYSTTTKECYDAGKLGQGIGYGHGQSHGNGGTNMYSNTSDVERFDSSMHGHGGGRTMYTTTTTDECFDSARPGHGYGVHGYGQNDGRTMAYTTTTTESFGGGEQGQGYYKKEVTQHKNRERIGEAGALAAGGFALYEGYEAKKDPAYAGKHQIEAGLAGAAAVGAAGYTYHQHREQKQPGYGGKQEYRMPVHNSYCN
ncbi:uncharacterized protein LOC123441065 [Hordeum vulgare subsp. vulgare]|uniref:Uncharacterized protein n=1 Tax=Hordeum vulgare subsp. vulgare TaxID=112509 RepID=A0A8I7BB79_HORVV|nr:uncharacterized protein LOC123441065 [Hordeum vulgare subsp. vulgare]